MMLELIIFMLWIVVIKSIINYGEEYYSYNYNKKCFMKVKYEDIYKNLENHLIGLYNDENFIKDRKEVRV